MTRASIFEGSDSDRPGLAAGLMAGALVTLALQDSIVRYAGADTTLWQFHFIRSSGNLVLLLVLARDIAAGFLSQATQWAHERPEHHPSTRTASERADYRHPGCRISSS